MSKTYSAKSTTSNGKLTSTDWALNLGKASGKGKCLYLVGCPEGLVRHVEDKVLLGFTSIKDHVVVERDFDTYIALCEQAKKICFDGVILHGDFLDCLMMLADSGDHIGHVDFDSVETYGNYSDMVIDAAVACGVEVIHIVNSTRNNNEYLSYMAAAVNMPHIRKWGNKRYITGPPHTWKVLPSWIKKRISSYNVQSKPYKGVGNHNMVITVLTSI